MCTVLAVLHNKSLYVGSKDVHLHQEAIETPDPLLPARETDDGGATDGPATRATGLVEGRSVAGALHGLGIDHDLFFFVWRLRVQALQRLSNRSDIRL